MQGTIIIFLSVDIILAECLGVQVVYSALRIASCVMYTVSPAAIIMFSVVFILLCVSVVVIVLTIYIVI